MVLVLQANLTYDEYAEWRDANIKYGETKGNINLKSWLKGCRFSISHHFPSHRRVNKRIGTWGYMVTPDRNKYHIIRHGKDKWRIVKAKSKKDKNAVSNIPVDADKVRCGDIVKALDNSLVQIHHIGEHGEVHYIAFADKEYGEMQRAPYRYTYGYITQFYTATIKEKTWLRKWIKQCKAGKIGHRI